MVITKNQLQENKAALELDRKELSMREQLKDKEGTGGLRKARLNQRQIRLPYGSLVTRSTDEGDKCNKHIQDDTFDEKKFDDILEQIFRRAGVDNADAQKGVDILIERLADIDEQKFSRFQYTSELEEVVRRVDDDIINYTRELEQMKKNGLNHRIQQLNEQASADLTDNETQVELWEKMRKGIERAHSALELPV